MKAVAGDRHSRGPPGADRQQRNGGNQKSEGRGQRSEVRGQRSDGLLRKATKSLSLCLASQVLLFRRRFRLSADKCFSPGVPALVHE